LVLEVVVVALTMTELTAIQWTELLVVGV